MADPNNPDVTDPNSPDSNSPDVSVQAPGGAFSDPNANADTPLPGSPSVAMASNLTAIHRIAPQMTQDLPGLATGIAQSGTGNLYQDTTALAAVHTAQVMKNNLEAGDGLFQYTQWEKSPPETRALLMRAGYRLPAGITPELVQKWKDAGALPGDTSVTQSSFGALYNNIPFLGKWGIAGIWHAIGVGAMDALKGIGKGINAITQPLQRLGREGDYKMALIQGKTIMTPDGPINGASAENFSRAWRDTKNGEHVLIDPEGAMKNLGFTFTKDQQNMAVDMAFGIPPEQLVKKYGANAYEEANTNQDFQTYVKDLDAQKLSPGRDLARAFGIHADNPMFKTVSGVGDAAYDWYTDPTILGGHVLQGMKLARADELQLVSKALMSNVEYTDQLFATDERVQRASAAVAAMKDANGTFDSTRFLQQFPKQGNMVDDLVAAAKRGELETAQDVHKVFRSAVEDMVEGTGEASKRGIINAPSLSSIQETWATGKYGAADWLNQVRTMAIDKPELLDFPGQVKAQAQLAFKKMAGMIYGFTQLTVPASVAKAGFDVIGDPKAAMYFERQLRLGDASAESIARQVNLFREGDYITRMNLITANIKNTFEGMARMRGSTLDAMPALKEMLDNHIEQIRNSVEGSGHAYEDGGELLSRLKEQVGPHKVNTPISVNQIERAGHYHPIDFGKALDVMNMYNWMHKTGITGGIADFAKLFIRSVWKPMQLLRIGFAVRVGLEEALREGMQRGWIKLSKSYLTSIEGQGEKALSWFGGKLFSSRSAVGQVRDVMSSMTEEAMAGDSAAQKLIEKGMYKESSTMAIHLHGSPAIPGELSSADHMIHETDAPELADARAGQQTRVLSLVHKGQKGYTRLIGSDSLNQWARDLQDWTGGEMDVVAPHLQAARLELTEKRLMDTLGEADREKVNTILEKHKEAAAKDLHAWYRENPSKIERSNILPQMNATGNRVSPGLAGTASMWDAQEELARRATAGLWGTVSDGDKRPIEAILDHWAANGEMPDQVTIAKQVPVSRWAGRYNGIDKVPHFRSVGHMLAAAQTSSFETLGKMIDAISRRPVYRAELAAAMDKTRPLYESWRKLMPEDAAYQMWGEISDREARNTLEGMIHDPEQRSQFSMLHRTAMPFEFAQEQFLKRWGKTLIRNPEAVRRYMLTMQGLRASGAVHKDANGDDYFVYPGSGLLSEALQSIPYLGNQLKVPIPVSFTGQIRYLAPGFDRPLMPSFGPTVMVPLKIMDMLSPGNNQTIKSLEAFLGGKTAVNSPWWETFVPASIRGLVKAGVSDENSPAMYSAMFSAYQWAAAHGESLPENATDKEKQLFHDKIKDVARGIAVQQAVWGFLGPASPSPKIYNDLSQEYMTLLKGSKDIHEASIAFLKAHPEASAYTMFSTEPAIHGLGGTLQPTTQVANFLKNNQAFVDKYGKAAFYFLPDNPGAYDPEAYREEKANGLRVQRTLFAGSPDSVDGMWEQSVIAKDSQIYYDSQKVIRDALTKYAGDTETLQNIRNKWDDWKSNYLATRPVFSRYLSERAVRQDERDQLLKQVHEALQDPLTPDSGHNPQVKTMVEAYLGMQDWFKAIKRSKQYGSDTSSVEREVKKRFAAWAIQDTDPMATMVYNSLIAPTVEFSV